MAKMLSQTKMKLQSILIIITINVKLLFIFALSESFRNQMVNCGLNYYLLSEHDKHLAKSLKVHKSEVFKTIRIK